jgi:hypothetical protein
VADSYNFTVRRVTPEGVVTTLAGNANDYGSFVDGVGSAARLDYPLGIAVNDSGVFFVADASQTIRRGLAVRPAVVGITRPAPNKIHLLCAGAPNAVNRIEFSLDLSPGSFATLASVMADSNGAFQYDDIDSAPKKFYRVSYP